jgi:hypothetical protein
MAEEAMALRLVEVGPRPMASIRPLGQDVRPQCVVLMVGGSLVPSTLGHRQEEGVRKCEEVSDILQALLGKRVSWFPWDPFTHMLQRRARLLPDDDGPIQLALMITVASVGAPLLLLGLAVRHLFPSHVL